MMKALEVESSSTGNTRLRGALCNRAASGPPRAQSLSPRKRGSRRAVPHAARLGSAIPAFAGTSFAHPLMSVVKPRTRKNPPSPETREKLFCDDRATVGAQPGDVGEQTLIRGFSHDRIFVRGFPCLRPGVDLTVGLIGCSGIPLAVATLPPLHNMIAAHCPSAGSLSVL